MKNTEESKPLLGERAIVLGASMAGLSAAKVLAPRFGEVVVMDRDDLPGTPQPRTRVPQERHPHLLLNAGTSVLEEWFPGLVAELEQAGAVDVDLTADFYWHRAGVCSGGRRARCAVLRCRARSWSTRSASASGGCHGSRSDRTGPRPG